MSVATRLASVTITSTGHSDAATPRARKFRSPSVFNAR